ncbi:MAG: hypothetical protein ACRDMX_13355 [Solirubrobacteraceae bacterium]
MLLKHRPPGIDSSFAPPSPGLDHLSGTAIAVLRWLNANKVDYVLVGPVARAIRGDLAAVGPVAIVPAPYGRNYERLNRALVAVRAGLRGEQTVGDGSRGARATPITLTPDKLARGRRWMLSLGDYDLDLERAGSHGTGGSAPAVDASVAGVGPRTPRYQELLYEASRFEIADGIGVEVAAPEDLEHYSHLRRTGQAPEFRVSRAIAADAAQEAEPTEPAAPEPNG